MSVWRGRVSNSGGYPNRVARAASAGGGMGMLGCACDESSAVMESISWRDAWEMNHQTQGRDVDYGYVSLAGLGDWVPASFPLPHNPITGDNALVRSLAGLNGFDVSHGVDAFVASMKSGKTFDLPNWAILAGGAAAAFFLMQSGGGKGRR